MKKHLLTSYVDGIRDVAHGESYGTIFRYFFPEFITALVLYSLLYWLDARWIAHLQSTSMYATLGVTNTMLHFIIKLGEGVSVATIVMSGQFNGQGKHKEVGETLANAFWVTVITGGMFAAILFFGAGPIYRLYGVPAKMVTLGIPFLRMRAIGIFFTFVYFAFIGFLRGIKNTRVPMNIFILGGVLFLFLDYALIFGAFGFPEMRMQGSALASVIQYGFMMVIAVIYVLMHRDMRKYSINLFTSVSSWDDIIRLLQLSWPVLIDKATMAGAYLWLGRMIAPMGTCALASFTVVKEMERCAILPALACAQVITFLVSNDYSIQNWDGIKSNIKKVIFLASCMMFAILVAFSIWAVPVVAMFDKKGAFTDFSARVFPWLSVLIFFDLLQLILSGALRGAGNVSTVMWVRLLVCLLFFVPVSYALTHFVEIANPVMRFFAVFGAFYAGNALMSVVYIKRFRGEFWKTTSI